MEGDSREKSTVTGACAANALAVAIPCQQVVKSGGALSGYRGA
jgi:AraC family transcriptional regulator of adaptative response/methylated-DNA-[protein]-cysteine methyltransferase